MNLIRTVWLVQHRTDRVLPAEACLIRQDDIEQFPQRQIGHQLTGKTSLHWDQQKPACSYAGRAADMHVSTCRKQIKMSELGPSFHGFFPRHLCGDASGRAQNPLESGS